MNVIQIFPNTASVLRLMGTVTLEYGEIQSTKERIFAENKFEAIRPALTDTLTKIASVQVSLLKAA